MSEPRTILITGANRGMGLEHVRQYAAAGNRVIATCRDPAAARELQQIARDFPVISLVALDITNQASIEALAAEMAGEPIDILLSNASFLSSINQERFGVSDFAVFEQSFAVNALGPYRMATAFVEHVAASRERKMIFITSAGGSIGFMNGPVYLPGYAAGKAALNALARSLHQNLADRGIMVGLLEPGIVDTQGFRDLKEGEPAPHGLDVVVDLVRKGQLAMQEPRDAVRKLQAMIDHLTPEQAGRVLRVDGEFLPW